MKQSDKIVIKLNSATDRESIAKTLLSNGYKVEYKQERDSNSVLYDNTLGGYYSTYVIATNTEEE